MGCGKSTLGSDSPRRSSQKTDDEEPDLVEQVIKSTKIGSLHATPTIPFSAGGPLLAQAKISESQVDFFKMLDEKIDKGNDCESDDDAARIDIKLQECLQKWLLFLSERKITPVETSSCKNNRSAAPMQTLKKVQLCQQEEPSDTSCSSSLDTVAEGSQPFKEQYMFMGSLYTLTRFNLDGTEIPKIDVSPVPSPLLQQRPAAVHSSSSTTATTTKFNGAYVYSKPRRLQRADTPATRSLYRQQKFPSRPASLVLQKVFPKRETNAT